MIIYDIFEIALKNLLRRKIRTFLTLIGIAIGTTSIAVMLSLGIGMDNAFNSEISKSGNIKVITVKAPFYPVIESYKKYSNLNKTLLDDNAVKEICNIDGVDVVSPELKATVKLVCGNSLANIDLVGIDPSKMKSFDYKIEKGRLLDREEKNVMVFGYKVENEFYNPRNNVRNSESSSAEPLVNLLESRIIVSFDMSYGESQERDTVMQRTYNTFGVGILAENGQSDYLAYTNIDYLRKIITDNNRQNGMSESVYGLHKTKRLMQYDQLIVKVKKINDVERIQKNIALMGFKVSSLIDRRKQMKNMLSLVQAVLGAIGATALLVACIGVTNTMYMSIFERTKEIGIIKVLGCNLNDIRKIFLVESGLLGFSGGIMGIALSYTISFLINVIAVKYMPLVVESISILPAKISIASICLTALISIIAGYLPAKRAMNISAIDAIRN